MARPTLALTQEQEIRLQVLSLVYRHDKDAPTLITRAKELEDYVKGKAKQETLQQ